MNLALVAGGSNNIRLERVNPAKENSRMLVFLLSSVIFCQRLGSPSREVGAV